MFLATTALSEFWDKGQEILFLGSWCLRHDKRSEWESLRYQVMRSPWDDRKRFYDATRYVDECGERMLKNLTDYLNSVHGVAHSERYWRILIGPWLLHCIHVFYDRYIHLEEAFSKYPSLWTVLLDRQSFMTPRDTMDFVSSVSDDPYNLEIFSEFLYGMGYSFPARLFDPRSPGPKDATQKTKPVEGLRTRLKRGFSLSCEGLLYSLVGNGRAMLSDLYVSRLSVWRLACHTVLHALPIEVNPEWSFSFSGAKFFAPRNRLTHLPSANEFERLFVNSLPQNFPLLYLEIYKGVRADVLGRYSHIPRVIVSAADWFFNEPFKFLAAETADKGSRLLASQHGGGYGIFRYSAPELHEIRLADSFMVWGWADDEGTCRNLPNPKLSSLRKGKPKQDAHCKEKTILFVGTAHPRYLYRFHSSPVGSQWKGYFQWESRFLGAIPEKIRPAVMFRAYPHDYGHGVREQIAERFTDIQWDDGKTFYKRIKGSHIVVIDNLGTTLLETLVANVPAVLFWDPNLWEVREEAEPYFERLRKVGILWHSPEAAAAKVAEIYDDPWVWWGSEALQEVRQRFVDRYALERKDWLDCWAEALEKEIALSYAGRDRKPKSYFGKLADHRERE